MPHAALVAGMNNPIRYWNRYTNREETESVYGELWIRLVYSRTCFRLTDFFLTSKWISKFYGWLQNTSLSRRKIAPFVEKFQITMSEFERGDFANFNEFFIRKFQSGARSFVREGIAAPAEARYLGYENASNDLKIPVKDLVLNPEQILGQHEFAGRFIGGPVLVARLCPVDYHRFHFPVDGKILARFSLGTKLHSVNPAALNACPAIFAVNERVVSILETKAGLMAYVEVGALCVGKIVESHSGEGFNRGDEKGYFLFGASTVLLFGEPGRWIISQDILTNTAQGRETFVRLGDTVAKKA